MFIEALVRVRRARAALSVCAVLAPLVLVLLPGPVSCLVAVSLGLRVTSHLADALTISLVRSRALTLDLTRTHTRSHANAHSLARMGPWRWGAVAATTAVGFWSGVVAVAAYDQLLKARAAP